MFVFISVWCHYVWRPRALVVRRLSKSTDLIWFEVSSYISFIFTKQVPKFKNLALGPLPHSLWGILSSMRWDMPRSIRIPNLKFLATPVQIYNRGSKIYKTACWNEVSKISNYRSKEIPRYSNYPRFRCIVHSVNNSKTQIDIIIIASKFFEISFREQVWSLQLLWW